MDPITLITAMATLLVNPKLGGGGISRERGAAALLHLVELIRGGRATAQALEAWGAEIKAMADAGVEPAQRDFERWTVRLDAALAGPIAEARARLEERGALEPKEIETVIEETKEPTPVESEGLKVADETIAEVTEDPIDEQGDQQLDLPVDEEEVESKSSAKRKASQRKGK